METAAGVIAIASIAIQLADSIKKLSDFWNAVKEAPSDVQIIIADLDLLCNVLEEIASEAQWTQSDAVLEKILCGCAMNIKQLDAILQELQPGFASTKRSVRQWTAIKSVLKWDKINKFQVILDRLKSSLMLVQQNQIRRSNRFQSRQQQQFFMNMTNMMSCLSINEASNGNPHHASIWCRDFSESASNATGRIEAVKSVTFERASDAADRAHSNGEGLHMDPEERQLVSSQATITTDQRSSIGAKLWKKKQLSESYMIKQSIFGNISVRSTQQLLQFADTENVPDWIEEDQFESQTSIIIRPAPWLMMLGIKYGFHWDFQKCAIQGWKHTLRSFYPVCHDAPIFRFCSEGNLSAVRQLLSNGEASARDTDPRGCTPLHFAAQRHNVELCKLLIMAGADTMAQSDGGTPGNSTVAYSFSSSDGDGLFDCIRLFRDCSDSSDSLYDQFIVSFYLIGAYLPPEKNQGRVATVERIIKHFSQEMKSILSGEWCALTLAFLAGDKYADFFDILLKYSPKEAVSAFHETRFSALCNEIIRAEHTVSKLLKSGVSPNGVGTHPDISARPESPTSLALYSSHAFSLWRSSLYMADIDINIVLDKGLEEDFLREDGWTRETLQGLVDWDFEVTEIVTIFPSPPYFQCSDCKQNVSKNFLKIQPLWLCALADIKDGKCPEDTSWARYAQSNSQDRFDVVDDESFDSSQKTADDLISISQGPDSDEETKNLRLRNSTSDTCPPLHSIDENPQEMQDERVARSEKPDRNAEMKDSVSMSSERNVEDPPFPYDKKDLLCYHCWRYFCRKRRRRHQKKTHPSHSGCSSDTDSSSDDDDQYSPFQINW